MRSWHLVFSIALLFTLQLRAQERPSLEDLKQQAIAAVDARQVFTQQMVDQIFSYAELIADTEHWLHDPAGYRGLFPELTDLAELQAPGGGGAHARRRPGYGRAANF